MGQFREIPVPENPVRVRLELSEGEVIALKRIGLEAGGISLAAVCRIGMGLFAEGAAPARLIVEKARRVRAENAPAKQEMPKRKPGRPKKGGKG